MLLGLMTCREALSRLGDYVDRELTEAEMTKVRAHLRICHACARKFRSEESLIVALRAKLDLLDIPTDLMASISRSLATDDPNPPDRSGGSVVS